MTPSGAFLHSIIRIHQSTRSQGQIPQISILHLIMLCTSQYLTMYMLQGLHTSLFTYGSLREFCICRVDWLSFPSVFRNLNYSWLEIQLMCVLKC